MTKMTPRQECVRFAEQHGLKVTGSIAKGWVSVSEKNGDWSETFESYDEMRKWLRKIYDAKRDDGKPYPWAVANKNPASLKKHSRAPRTTPIQKLALVGENPRARMAATELQALQKATRWRVYDAKSNRLLFSAPDRATAVEFARAYADAKDVQLSVEDNSANEARKARK